MTRTWTPADFPGLLKKMQQVLRQGGQAFINILEPLQLEITTVPEMQALLKHFRSDVELTRIIARSIGLTVDPVRCMDRLQETPRYFVRPELWADPRLAFLPTQSVAPREIRRWMKNGFILPWLETLTTRFGSVERENADGHMAREILGTGLALATLLDEFHPQVSVFSSTAERLERRLVVFKRALQLKRKDRGLLIEKRLTF